MTEGMKIVVKADFSGETAKTETIRRLPRAFFINAEDWASRTVLFIKESYKGGNTFKRPPKEIDNRLGMKITKTGPTEADILIGTGEHIGRAKVVYARIQEEGGVVKPTRGKFLTIPFPGVKGFAANYPKAFLATTAGGQWLLAEPKGKTGIRPLFLLRKSVRLPPRFWFSRPIAAQKPLLARMMSPDGVWQTARKLAAEYAEQRKKRGT